MNGITGRKTSQNGGFNIRYTTRGMNWLGPTAKARALPSRPRLAAGLVDLKAWFWIEAGRL